MSNRNDTAAWTKWVMGFLILTIIGMVSYMGTAVATEAYHDKDMRQRDESAKQIEAARKETRDERHTQIMNALTELKREK